jgi:hypothetical protein
MSTKNVAVHQRTKDSILWILILGSLWGLSEAIGGSVMRTQMLSVKATVLTGIGFGIMGIALGSSKKPLLLIVMALIAAASTQIAVPLLGCSILCRANSSLALMLHASCLYGAFTLFKGKSGNAALLSLTGFSAAMLSSGIFFFAGMRLAPCVYLLSFNHSGGMLSFLAAEGIAWALFAGIALPIGYRIGAHLQNGIVQFRSRPSLYYGASAAIIIFCWAGITLIAISNNITS